MMKTRNAVLLAALFVGKVWWHNQQVHFTVSVKKAEAIMNGEGGQIFDHQGKEVLLVGMESAELIIRQLVR